MNETPDPYGNERSQYSYTTYEDGELTVAVIQDEGNDAAWIESTVWETMNP